VSAKEAFRVLYGANGSLSGDLGVFKQLKKGGVSG
jgi:hypothetical protein